MIRRQRHHGSSAPTHGGRDKGAAHGSFSQFRGVRPERGAVAAQGPPQLSDGGDLRRAASPCRRVTTAALQYIPQGDSRGCKPRVGSVFAISGNNNTAAWETEDEEERKEKEEKETKLLSLPRQLRGAARRGAAIAAACARLV
ncbi:hypothetical protein ALC62_06872 [Cyphomyrmex costatus]|uniref:Uncharacterized protein n=1 Tax=Cyphomyrmex costatus TaxID=456900 RepID=A0A151IIE9_9HYME|nr:hypothetical protein ALC62_06872 [Cyphomyrmex costatus]